MSIVRWTLLIPAAILAWYAVFAAGLFAHSFVERALCPPEELVSGFCTNDQVQAWLTILVHGFVGLSAWAVGAAAVAVAPTRKEAVVWVTLAVGLIAAGYFGVETGEWSLFAVAAFSGIVGALLIARYLRAIAPNHSLQARLP